MIIVAIDEIDFDRASLIIDNLDSTKCMVKIGSISFNSIGKDIIYYAAEKGFDIFLDLKLHDIPNTVKKTIQGLSLLPITMLTIHTSGGKDMMLSAMEAVKNSKIKVFGVTALTSLSDEDTLSIFKRTTSDQVNAMLDIAEFAGIDGVVCSPHELKLVNSRRSLLAITPGIRIKDLKDDQKRVMTPKEAIDMGSDFIVIGRPITLSSDISKSLNEVYESIQ
ncbi:MAG: orotidine 5'-phosphate decarboxylase [SAR86 cluster bacterium SAR86A]|uniref:Orotidine 5'-phosphate decarboxylase n=1 Tax=SAR86 cluster bacterium SAR86A TaxID=1123866 RepID=J4KRJ3_9GAMM|nr:MAG: orotidine 5'-phosphate decarboxylase [SAR86 cluster bacterium SAR86A]